MWHGRPRVYQRIVSALVSMTLALPLQAFAEQPRPDNPANLKLGFLATPAPETEPSKAGAVIQKYKVNGEDVTVTMATVEQKDEAQFLEQLAKTNPDNSIVAFSDKEDPALGAAKKSGFFSRLKSVFVGKKPEAIPALQNEAVPAKVRSGVIAKIKSFGQTLNKDKRGVAFSIAYSTGMSAFTYYQSASVEAAIGQFLPTLVWSGFLTIFSHKWFQYLDKSGSVSESIGKLIGQNTNQEQAYAWNATGQFLGALAANSLLALYTLYVSGGLMGAFQVAWMGFIMNSNVVDPTVRRWKNEGKVSERFEKNYMPLMQLASATVEISAFFGVPFAGMALGVVVVSGLTYLLAGPSLEKKIPIWKQAIAGRMRRAGHSLRGRFNKTVKHCAQFLAPPQEYSPPPDEFISWASIQYGR